MKRCVVLAGAPIDFPVENLIGPSDFVICADRGWIQAEERGIVPDLIVGDFDSSPRPPEDYSDVEFLPVIKDDTDTHHIARYIVDNGFTDVLLAGVTGGDRIEHTFANVASMLYLSKNGINATAMDSRGFMIVVTDGNITLPKAGNCFLSLFPLGDRAEGVSVKGAMYELEDAVLTNDFPLGVSNEFRDGDAQISVKKGSLLITVTRKD